MIEPWRRQCWVTSLQSVPAIFDVAKVTKALGLSGRQGKILVWCLSGRIFKRKQIVNNWTKFDDQCDEEKIRNDDADDAKLFNLKMSERATC